MLLLRFFVIFASIFGICSACSAGNCKAKSQWARAGIDQASDIDEAAGGTSVDTSATTTHLVTTPDVSSIRFYSLSSDQTFFRAKRWLLDRASGTSPPFVS